MNLLCQLSLKEMSIKNVQIVFLLMQDLKKKERAKWKYSVRANSSATQSMCIFISLVCFVLIILIMNND